MSDSPAPDAPRGVALADDATDPPQRPVAAPSRFRRALGRVALAGLGVIAIVWLVHETKSAEHVLGALPVLPALLALEALRIVSEGLAVRAQLGAAGRDVPLRTWFGSVLAGYGLAMLLPAGRVVSEAYRAATLTPHLGAGRALVLGVEMQTLTLTANAAVALVSAAVLSLVLSAHGIAAIVAAVGVVTFALALLVFHAARGTRLADRARRFRAIRDAFAAFEDERAMLRFARPGPLVFVTVMRLFQVVELGILVKALGGGGGVVLALAAQGVQLVGATAGDVIPAQLGAVDAAFALAASLLSLDKGRAVALSVLLHAAQLVAVAVSLVLAALAGDAAKPVVRPSASSR